MAKIIGSDAGMSNEEFLWFVTAMNAELMNIAKERGMAALAQKLQHAAEESQQEVQRRKSEPRKAEKKGDNSRLTSRSDRSSSAFSKTLELS